MGEVIYLSQRQAADMTTFRELIKFYTGKKSKKFEAAIEKNKDRYQFILKEVLATKAEASEEDIAA